MFYWIYDVPALWVIVLFEAAFVVQHTGTPDALQQRCSPARYQAQELHEGCRSSGGKPQYLVAKKAGPG